MDADPFAKVAFFFQRIANNVQIPHLCPFVRSTRHKLPPLQRQAVTGFYLVHHEGVLDGAEDVYEEVIVILHIPSRFETAKPFEYRNRAAALFDSSITIIAVLITESSGLPEADLLRRAECRRRRTLLRQGYAHLKRKRH